MTASTPRRRRYPLHVYIASLFTALVTVTGVLIAAVDYANARRLALDAVADVFQRSARETQAELRASHEPIRTLVSLLLQRPESDAGGPETELRNLPLILHGLESAPVLSTLYVAYAAGGQFSIRRLDHAAARRAVLAPEQAAYLVRVAKGGERRISEFFYDDSARRISTRTHELATIHPPWLEAALHCDGLMRTAAFPLESGEIGYAIAGATADRRLAIGADLTLKSLSATLSRQRPAPSARLALVDGQGQVLAASHGAWPSATERPDSLPSLTDLDLSILARALARGIEQSSPQTFRHEGRDWETLVVSSALPDGEPLYIVMAAPHDELLADVQLLRRQALLSLLAVLLVAVPATWWIARRISFSLRELAADARSIRRFDFAARDVASPVLEVDELGQSMTAMRSAIRQFLDISVSLVAAQRFQPLLDGLVDQTVGIARAAAGAVYLPDPNLEKLVPSAWKNVDVTRFVHPPGDIGLSGKPHLMMDCFADGTLRTGTLGPIGEPEGLEWIAACFPGQRVDYLAVPLRNRANRTNGVLLLVKPGGGGFSPEQSAFINTLAGPLAIAIDNHGLIKAQKQLFNAVIRVVAGAIDAKSPYTGGHCQRVPELARMLAAAACAAPDGPLRGFAMSDDDWEALTIAAWLHDCGKLTTPEFVVDKSTKLETLYDRIHEIRMRFEVLKRDAQIACWQGIASGGDPGALAARRDAVLAELDADFTFVAACNLGSETLSSDARARLARIAQRTWQRTLDDRLGISHAELLRKERLPARALPAEEFLLADRDDHRIPHEETPLHPGMNLSPPRHRLDLGELHALSVATGTLTEEERYLINHHIVQTIAMLDGLPFPDYLRQVPGIAGKHHEHLDGSGYPRGLGATEMDVPARILAIADIFEALTAGDRPYKRGKRLSEAVALLAGHVRQGHLDADLFELFLRAGVHLRFAERFLAPDQIDAVDVEATLRSIGPTAA